MIEYLVALSNNAQAAVIAVLFILAAAFSISTCRLGQIEKREKALRQKLDQCRCSDTSASGPYSKEARKPKSRRWGLAALFRNTIP